MFPFKVHYKKFVDMVDDADHVALVVASVQIVLQTEVRKSDLNAGALLYLKPEFNLELNLVLEGFVVASSLAGAWVSAVCSGPSSDWLGRRFILCISAFFYLLLSATIMAWSPDVYVLVVCRILMGIGTGFSVTLVPAYIAESAPSEIRGQLATLPQLMGSGGLFVAYIIVFLLSLEDNPNWRYMLAMTAIPSLLYLIMAIFYLPESPRWLVRKGRMSEAGSSTSSR